MYFGIESNVKKMKSVAQLSLNYLENSLSWCLMTTKHFAELRSESKSVLICFVASFVW